MIIYHLEDLTYSVRCLNCNYYIKLYLTIQHKIIKETITKATPVKVAIITSALVAKNKNNKCFKATFFYKKFLISKGSLQYS